MSPHWGVKWVSRALPVGLHIVSLIGSPFLLPDLLQFEVICNDFEAVITGASSNAPSGMHVGGTDIHILEKGKPITRKVRDRSESVSLGGKHGPLDPSPFQHIDVS
jgi:hypothetical protein